MVAHRHGHQQTLPQLGSPARLRPETEARRHGRPIPGRKQACDRPAVDGRQEQEFRALAENLPDAVLRHGRDLRCVYANPAVEHCLGLAPQQVVGQTIAALELPRRLATRWDRSLRLVLAGGQTTAIEFTLSTRRGERHIEARTVPEFGPDGAIASALTIARDVTERRRAERALLGKTAALQQTNAELEEFAYVASHDLKGPLRNAHALSTWIEEEVADHLSEAGRQRLALMRDRLRRMDDLINATLDYANAAATVGAREAVDVGGLARDIAAACRCPAGFTVSVAADMPRLRTDRKLLHQVLSILVGNAVKHHDRADGRVWVTAADAGSFVELAVIDDGPGIPPEYHERIFHMFQRGPNEPAIAGHGLGLAIARKIVGHVGGQLRLDSAPGWGSTFHFTWPKVL